MTANNCWKIFFIGATLVTVWCVLYGFRAEYLLLIDGSAVMGVGIAYLAHSHKD